MNDTSTRKEPWPERIHSLILGYSKAMFGVVATIALLLAVLHWRDIARVVLPRITHVEAFGFKLQIESLKQAFDAKVEPSASGQTPIEYRESTLSEVIYRARSVAPILDGADLLWMDDHPSSNESLRSLLRGFGVRITTAQNIDDALASARTTTFDVVLSDIKRETPDTLDGIAGLKKLREAGVSAPAIFYIWRLWEPRVLPATALGITNRPDELLHLVIDGLERTRWQQLRSRG
ncbi:MAG: response regulator [Planctomycetota bacterium]